MLLIFDSDKVFEAAVSAAAAAAAAAAVRDEKKNIRGEYKAAEKFIEFIASSTANAVHHNVHSNSNET